MAPDGSDVTRLTLWPDQFKEGPHWSPDGSMIAFATPSELTLVNVTVTRGDRRCHDEL